MALVDSNRYNKLPHLAKASEQLQALDTEAILSGAVRDVFIRHNVQNELSLYVAHRHHHLGRNEAVVKVHGTAHLMSGQEMRDIEAIGNKIVPVTWMGSSMLPMEFSVLPREANNPTISPEFVRDLCHVLASSGCEELFGVDTIGGVDWTELTIGSASVVVPSNGNDREDAYVPVAFAFDAQTPGFRVHGRCGTDHKHSSKPEPK